MASRLNFPSFLYIDKIRESSVDFSYFSYFLPNHLATFSLIQGHTLSKYRYIRELVLSGSEEIVQMNYSSPEMILLKRFLKHEQRIKKIFLTEKGLHIQPNTEFSERITPPSQIFPSNAINIQKIASRSIRFLPIDTSSYLSIFLHILTELHRTTKVHLNLFLYGADCHFLACILRRVYRPYLHAVIVNSNTHTLHIHTRKLAVDSPLLTDLKNEIIWLTKKISKENKKKKESSEEEDFLDSFYSPSNASSSPSQIASSASHDIFSKKNLWLGCSYLAYHIRCILLANEPNEKQWEILWPELEKRFPVSWIWEFRAYKSTLKRLALLKARIETHSFDLSHKVGFLVLNYTSLYQTVRSLCPHGAVTPNVSIWINHKPFIWNSNTPGNLSFYHCLFQEFAKNYDDKKDYLNLAQKLIHLQEMQKEEIDQVLSDLDWYERRFFHMLQASSFSFFLHADIHLREVIAPKLLETHKLKYATPQTAPTVEFFIDRETNFKVIRTSNYFIQKNGIDLGEFIVKWMVSICKYKWSFCLEIPAIDLYSSLSLEEGEEIYRKFEPIANP